MFSDNNKKKDVKRPVKQQNTETDISFKTAPVRKMANQNVKSIKGLDIKPGEVIISELKPNQKYLVMETKTKNNVKVYACLPIVSRKAGVKQSLEGYFLNGGRMVVFDKEEMIYEYQIISLEKSIKEKFSRIQIAFDNYKEFASEEERERYNVAPHDGFRSGNAWEGLVSVPGRIKVFRG